MAASQVVPQTEFCDLCEEKIDATYYCITCGEKLCDKCKIRHSKGRKTRYDKVVPLNENPISEICPPLPISCARHAAKDCDLYCKTCSKHICSECIIKDHQGHVLITFSAILNEINQKFVSDIELLKKEIDNFKDKLLCLEKRHSNFNISDVKHNINQRSSELISQIIHERDRCISVVTDIEQEEHRSYCTCRDALEKRIQELEDIVHTTDDTDRHSDITVIDRLSSDVKRLSSLLDISLPSVRLPVFSCSKTNQTEINTMFGSSFIYLREQPIGLTDLNNINVNTIQSFKRQEIFVLIPINKHISWVCYRGDTYLTQIEMRTGNEVGKSVDIGEKVNHGDLTSFFDIIISTVWGNRLRRLSNNGSSVSVIADASPLCFMGVHVTEHDEILTPVRSKLKYNDTDAQIRRYTLTGKLLQVIHKVTDGSPMLSRPSRLTCLRNGDIFIIDDDHKPQCVIKVDSQGKFPTRMTIPVGDNAKAVRLWDIKHDDKDNVYITCPTTNQMYVTDSTGQFWSLFTDKQNVKEAPCCLAIYGATLIIGCVKGVLYEVK